MAGGGTNTVGNQKLRGAKIGSPGPMKDEEMKKEGTKSAAAGPIRGEKCKTQT